MFGRSKKCHFCGSKDNLSRCSCGKQFCPVHGVSGSCMECYSSGLTRTIVTTMPLETSSSAGVSTPKGKTEARPKRPSKGAPRRLSASIRFGSMERDELQESLMNALRGHHFICFAQRRVAKVERGREIEVLFHGDRVLNSLPIEDTRIEVSTDLRGVPSKALEAVGSSLDDLGASGALRSGGSHDAFRAVLHHNEISWLTQVVLLTKGAEVGETGLEWEIGAIPVREYGPMCPWCGTSVAPRGGKCSFCGRDVPERIPARELITRHLKRQFGDKIVGVRTRYREGEISQSEYRSRTSQLESARDAVDRVSWGQAAEF